MRLLHTLRELARLVQPRDLPSLWTPRLKRFTPIRSCPIRRPILLRIIRRRPTCRMAPRPSLLLPPSPARSRQATTATSTCTTCRPLRLFSRPHPCPARLPEQASARPLCRRPSRRADDQQASMPGRAMSISSRKSRRTTSPHEASSVEESCRSRSIRRCTTMSAVRAVRDLGLVRGTGRTSRTSRLRWAKGLIRRRRRVRWRTTLRLAGRVELVEGSSVEEQDGRRSSLSHDYRFPSRIIDSHAFPSMYSLRPYLSISPSPALVQTLHYFTLPRSTTPRSAWFLAYLIDLLSISASIPARFRPSESREESPCPPHFFPSTASLVCWRSWLRLTPLLLPSLPLARFDLASSSRTTATTPARRESSLDSSSER